jgi:hypothetical protein
MFQIHDSIYAYPVKPSVRKRTLRLFTHGLNSNRDARIAQAPRRRAYGLHCKARSFAAAASTAVEFSRLMFAGA